MASLTLVHRIYKCRWHLCLEQSWGDTKDGTVKSLRRLWPVILPRWELANEHWHSKPLPTTLAGCVHPIYPHFQQHSGAFQDSALHQTELLPSKAVCRVLCLHFYTKEMDGELNQLVIKDELLISLLLLNYPIRMEIMNLDRGFKSIVHACFYNSQKSDSHNFS